MSNDFDLRSEMVDVYTAAGKGGPATRLPKPTCDCDRCRQNQRINLAAAIFTLGHVFDGCGLKLAQITLTPVEGTPIEIAVGEWQEFINRAVRPMADSAAQSMHK